MHRTDGSELQESLAAASRRRKLLLFLVFLLISAAVVALNYRALHDPIANDTALFPIYARVITGETVDERLGMVEGRGLAHPALYLTILVLLAKTVGSDLIYARIGGLGFGLANACLLAWLVRLLLPQGVGAGWYALLAVAMFVTNPFGRLGMIHTEIDETVLPLMLLACVGCAEIFLRRRALGWGLGLILLQAGAFWAKLTTPLLFPVSMAARLLAERRVKLLWLPVAVALGGGAIFTVTWWGYCEIMNCPPAFVFSAALGLFRAKARPWDNPLHIFQSMLAVFYWFNPAFLLLSTLATFRLYRNGFAGRGQWVLPAALGWSTLIGYLFIGGVAYTIPKYQYSAIPLLALLTTAAFREYVRVPARAYLVWGALIPPVAGYYYMLGDPFYRLLYGFRAYLWKQDLGRQIPVEYVQVLAKDIALMTAPILATVFLIFIVRRGDRLAYLLFFLVPVMFAYNAGVALRQAQADYTTTYNYGMKGAQAVLDQMHDGARVLLYEGGIVGPWSDKQVRFVQIEERTPDAVLVALRDPEIDCFVVGLAINTVEQLAALQRHEGLKAMLDSQFDQRRIDDFTLYLRRHR